MNPNQQWDEMIRRRNKCYNFKTLDEMNPTIDEIKCEGGYDNIETLQLCND